MKHWYTNAIVLSSLLVFNMIIYSIVMFAIVTIRKDTTIRCWEVNKVHISNLISYQAMPSVVSVNVRQSIPLSYSSKGTTRAHKRGSVRQKQARRAGTSNYIQQYPWDVIIGIDTNIEVIVVSLTTWEAHHSPRAKPEGCGELPRSLMRQQWPKLRYQFLFYHDETKLMMNKQILSI